MSEARFDIASIGKTRFGMGALISGGFALFAVIYFNPSITHLLVGIGSGVLVFMLRQTLLGNKRFQRRLLTQRIGLLTIVVATLLIGYFAFREFWPELSTFGAVRDFIWVYLGITLAICFESIAGVLFYARSIETDLPD